MKVFFVTPEFVTEEYSYDGGLANYIYKVSRELIKRGIEVTVLVSAPRNEELVHDGIKVIRVSVRNRLLSLLSRLTFLKFEPFLRWVYQSYCFDRKLASMELPEGSIIQFPSYTVPSLLFRNRQKPYVVRVSGFQPEILVQYGTPKSSVLYKQIHWLEKRMFLKSRFLFGPSSTIAALLKNEFGVNVKVIRTPFSLPPYISKDLSNLAGKKYFLFFGTVGLLKGVSDIAEILEKLLLANPKMNFVFVGKDGGYLGGTMMDYVIQKAPSCRNRIVYLGKRKAGELYPLLENAHRVILPSRFDNLPNTCIEAMALGKIVVGTRNSSIDELIEDGKTGFLCEKENPESLFDAIQRSLNLSVTEEKAISEAAKGFTDNLNSDRVVLELIEFYKWVLKSWSSQ